jgi:hypothetical protein
MMEAVRTSETSVYSNETTGRYIQKAQIFILANVKVKQSRYTPWRRLGREEV